ncbi:unnamed protein product [Discosporangium mesarthrocarpum]
MDSSRGTKGGHTLKAVALAWLAVSSEAFTVSNNIRASRGFGIRSNARASCTAVGPRVTMRPLPAMRGVTMAAEGSNNPVAALAALLGAATIALHGGPALAADAPMANPPPGPAAMQTQAVQAVEDIRYSDFIKAVNNDEIEKVSFSYDGKRLVAVDTDGGRVKMDSIPNDPELLTILTKHKVDVTVMPNTQKEGNFGQLGSLIFPALLFGTLLFLARRAGQGGPQGGPPGGMGGPGGMPGGGNPMEFSRSKGKLEVNPDTGVTFDQVAGCDKAKFELEEVVDFLKNPAKYTKVGAKIPRGVILEGPPGTGKTLLARAVAGEAGVPFIATSGSEFVEMFVGVGAARVRDLFDKAKENAPCIIFIDEIDAVGRQRGSGMAGGNDEREQTLNQMLVEMDGFIGNPGVIVIAATNRIDILDDALLRPGRFDRRVYVDLPGYAGRIAILKVHARGKPLAPDVDIEGIARRTPGFSGAELKNLLNEAAIFAARKKRPVPSIEWEDVDGAVDRLLVGIEKTGGRQNQEMRQIVAYHEAGHAIIGALMPDYDMVQKVTIVPRSNGAGGLTFFSPSEDRLESGLYSKVYMESQLAVALGGRLAEELVFGEDGVTTGASNDFEQVTNIANRMVAQWGMSKEIGPFVVNTGLQGQQGSDEWGPSMVQRVNLEVERLVEQAYYRGKQILVDNRDLLDALAQKLIEQDTVSQEELALLLVQYDAQTAPYGVYEGVSDKSKLPFKEPVSNLW